jgi:hypothetical protein
MTAGISGGFSAVFIALYVAHQVADHWVQTDHQAVTKGEPGWVGRWSCLKHVGTYTLTCLLAVLAVALFTGLHVSATALATGLLVNAVSHYVADRRTPLRIIADWVGLSRFSRLATAGLNGAYLLDQSWHIGWLFLAALLIGGQA